MFKRRINHPITLNDFCKKNPKAHVLIIRSLGGLGELLMTLPAIRELKTRHPNITITYAIDRTPVDDIYFNLIKNLSFINFIVEARLVDPQNYDKAVCLDTVSMKEERLYSISNDVFPLQPRVDLFGYALGLYHIRDKKPPLLLEKPEIEFAKSLALPQDKKLIFVHTASYHRKRCWPVESYLDLIKNAQTLRPELYFLISDYNNYLPDISALDNVRYVTNSDIRKLAAVMNICDMFLGPDSGPMHIAGALQIPSVCLFGSVPPKARIGYYDTHISVEAPERLPCQYCMYSACNFNYKCMKMITWQQVIEKL